MPSSSCFCRPVAPGGLSRCGLSAIPPAAIAWARRDHDPVTRRRLPDAGGVANPTLRQASRSVSAPYLPGRDTRDPFDGTSHRRRAPTLEHTHLVALAGPPQRFLRLGRLALLFDAEGTYAGFIPYMPLPMRVDETVAEREKNRVVDQLRELVAS